VPPHWAEKAQAYPMGVNTNSHLSKLAQNLGSLRLNTAKSLAIPAAASIHNARLYEWAQI